MTVLLRVLILLACGPLLVPPVACACHATEAEDTHDCPADDHAPGCPALFCADPGLAPVVVSKTVVADLVWDSLFSFAFTSVESKRPVTLPPPDHGSDPPLYLSHCALVR